MALALRASPDAGPALMGVPTSAPAAVAGGLLALLAEDDPSLQLHALNKLDAHVDSHWADVADALTDIERLAESPAFAGRQHAALICAKVFYHLEAYGDAVRNALAAGDRFDIFQGTAFVDTIVSRCIDEYTAARQAIYEAAHREDAAGAATPPAVDPRLESVVNRMFDRCWREAGWKQALGVALEARRLDAVEETLRRAIAAAAAVGDAGAGVELLAYAVELVCGGAGMAASGAGTLVSSLPKAWRHDVLTALQAFYERPAVDAASGAVTLGGGDAVVGIVSDYAGYGRLLQALGDAAAYATLLTSLVGHAIAEAGDAVASRPRSSVPDSGLLAFQLAVDAVETDNQSFLVQLHAAAMAAANAAAPAADAGAGAPAPAAAPAVVMHVYWSRLLSILDGSVTAAAYMDFLSHTSATDALILRNTKNGVDPKVSVLHNAIVIAHGYMNCGTSIDTFLRNNLDWLVRANYWNKFSAAASQGVVHKGRLGDSMRLLEAYLPREGGVTEDAHAEGGALFALGLIHANRGAALAAGVATRPVEALSAAVTNAAAGAGAGAGGGGGGGGGHDVVTYLHNQLRNTRNDIMQHGACLGLGCAAMGTGDADLFNSMREVVFQESAVAGEGAALGIGLLLAGKGAGWRSDATEDAASAEMLGHAHDTEHEKTIRGIAMALALMCYGLEDGADVLIGQCVRDKDALIRYGGMFAIGLAYVGTGSNAAVRQLLHVAVSDVSDDVRRAAVMALGFVLCRQWREVPTLVAQLAASYNPHVRYGAALAVGIACAGSGLPDAVGLLEPLLDDPADFVRQGALLGLGLVLQQESGDHLPRVTVIRERMAKLVSDRHVSTMTRMGAIMAQGVIDMGGRNCITSMVSRSSFIKMSAVVGVALWIQHWYWFPLAHFLSLAAAPTLLVGISGDFRVATTWSVECACRPSWFAYPPALEDKKEEKAAAVTTVELSTAARARAKAAAKGKDKAAGASSTGAPSSDGDVTMAGTAAPAPAPAPAPASDAASLVGAPAPASPPSLDAPEGGAAAAGAGAAAAATSFHLANPARVTLSQAKFLDFDSVATHRFRPVRKPTATRLGSGIMFLRDNLATGDAAAAGEDAEARDKKELRVLRAPAASDESAMAPVPDVFEWVIGEYM